MSQLSHVRIVLVQPRSPGNIGACARAMASMGLDQLWLVQPVAYPHEDATRRAAEAVAVLDGARVVDHLGEALADCTLVVAASARQRRGRWPTLDPRQTASKLRESQEPVALMFGSESSGLSSADLYQAHYQTSIPMGPDSNSLNLSHAVQIYAWELAGCAGPDQPDTIERATHQQMAHLYDAMREVLDLLEFSRSDPDHLLLRFKALLNRAQPSRDEWSLFEGLLQRMKQRCEAAQDDSEDSVTRRP